MSGLEASLLLIGVGTVALALVTALLGLMFLAADRLWWSR